MRNVKNRDLNIRHLANTHTHTYTQAQYSTRSGFVLLPVLYAVTIALSGLLREYIYCTTATEYSVTYSTTVRDYSVT